MPHKDATMVVPERDALVGTSLRLEKRQVTKLDEMAAEKGRSRSEVARLLLDFALERVA